MKIVAVNGRRASDELLHNAIKDSVAAKDPIELIVDNQGFFKVLKLDYHGGEKYPHLTRVSKTAAILDDIVKPLANSTRVAAK
jgi:hypothetical protein